MNERTLLRLIKDGDTGALSEIIGIYTPYLFAIASNIMAPALSQEDIEEAVSDSFVALWQNARDVAPDKLKPWLAAVCRNKARDALRSRKLAEPLDDDLLEVAAPGDMEESVLRTELSTLAREAVETLGEPDGEIFRRHYFLYQKTGEIAEELGMNAATVRTKLRRGRERLRAYFTERGYGCADPNL
ncbi:MAG: sigma-70 family RNA polymerase sigma factor [Oscillospiraceae bacterium]|nr:sigma-70 family RNA polymerase sigma factor [Oscillospiraceae bacterium]